jgi:hypothetical protein
VKKSGHVTPLVTLMAVIVALSPYFATIAYASPPNIPSSVVVAVGYGDTERTGACVNCFPSPWCGSPGVQFIGSSTNYDGNPTDASNCAGGDWDGGAMLVTNTGTTSITLTGLTVTLPLPLSGGPGSPSCPLPARPVTFNLWFGQQYYYGNLSDPAYDGSPITIPSGRQAIFAETSSDGSEVCPSGNYPAGPTGGTYDFDTSDLNFLSGCTPTTDTVSDPQITFSATGYAPTTYIDTGHTLDTGGIDTGMCNPTAANPEWPNEALGWRIVSSDCGESCLTNQFLAPTAVGAGATTTVTATVTVSGSATTVTASGASGVSTTTVYGIEAVAVVFIIATGYLAMRGRKSAS